MLELVIDGNYFNSMCDVSIGTELEWESQRPLPSSGTYAKGNDNDGGEWRTEIIDIPSCKNVQVEVAIFFVKLFFTFVTYLVHVTSNAWESLCK